MEKLFYTVSPNNNTEVTTSFIIQKQKSQLMGLCTSERVEIGNVGQYILRAFKNEPDFIGQIDVATGRTTTFQEMREKSVKCAIYMMANGVEKGDVVSICIHNHIDAYIPYLACLYIGAVADLWHEDYLKDATRTLNFLLRSKPKIVFTNSKFVDKFKCSILYVKTKLQSTFIVTIDRHVTTYLYVDHVTEKISNKDVDNFSCANINMMDPAVTMFSPTTNIYCNNVSFPNMLFTSVSNMQPPSMEKNQVGLWYTPFCSLRGPFLTVHAILTGVKVLKPGKFQCLERMFRIIEEYKVDWVFLESKLCNKIPKSDLSIDLTKYKLSSLKQIVCDSEIHYITYIKLMEILPNVSIEKVYCMVETGVIGYLRNSHKMHAHGYVAQSMNVIFIDRISRTIVKSGYCGEIWCNIPSVITTVNGTQILASHFCPTIKLYKKEIGWFFTGDWGYCDKQGAICVLDKVNCLINIPLLMDISVKDIEKKLEMHPQVDEVHVVARCHPNYDIRVVAYIKSKLGIKKQELLKYLKTYNMDHVELKNLNECNLLRLPNGRIDRLRLR